MCVRFDMIKNLQKFFDFGLTKPYCLLIDQRFYIYIFFKKSLSIIKLGLVSLDWIGSVTGSDWEKNHVKTFSRVVVSGY